MVEKKERAMSVKLIAAAIVFAGVVGAGASYLQHNPNALSSAGSGIMALHGAAFGESPDSTSRSANDGYRICMRDFSRVMTRKTPLKRQEACRCFGDAYGTWTTASQEIAVPLIYLRLFESSVRDSIRLTSQTAYPRNGSPSGYESSVRRAQGRDIAGQLERNAMKFSRDGTANPLTSSPFQSILMQFRLRLLFQRCDIAAL